MNVRSVGHRYRGPQPTKWGGSIPIMYRGICTCGWAGIDRVTRHQARADWLLHNDRAAAEAREDAEFDRAKDVDL